MNKKVIAAGSIITSLVLLGSVTTSFAQNALSSTTNPHRAPRQRGIGNFGLTGLAAKLGISSDVASQIKTELQSGKKIADVLKEHNIDATKLEGAWKGTTKQQRALLVNDPTVVQAEATALGISTEELKQDFSNGQKIGDIIKTKGLTMDQFLENSANAVQTMIQNGQISSDQIAKYTKLIKKFQKQATK